MGLKSFAEKDRREMESKLGPDWWNALTTAQQDEVGAGYQAGEVGPVVIRRWLLASPDDGGAGLSPAKVPGTGTIGDFLRARFPRSA